MKTFFITAVLTILLVVGCEMAYAQQAVAPGKVAPVAQHLKDQGVAFAYVGRDNGVVLVTIFANKQTPEALLLPATACGELSKIGHVTKVTVFTDFGGANQGVIIERGDTEINIHDGSMTSTVCTDKRHQ